MAPPEAGGWGSVSLKVSTLQDVAAADSEGPPASWGTWEHG